MKPNAARILLVVGPDTGVGKTFVGAALCRALRRQGWSVVAVKPVESGVALEGPEDGEILAEATGQAEPPRALDRLQAPVAPPVAADMEGVSLDPERWTEEIRRLAQNHDVVLVEGAGGLLSPITWELSALDLCQTLEARALVVAQDRLGVISQSRLVLSVLRSAGCEILGLVLNGGQEGDEVTGTHRAAFERLEPEVAMVELASGEPMDACVDRLSRWLDEVTL